MKKIAILILSLFGTSASLLGGPGGYLGNVFNAAGSVVKSPFVLAGALLGVSSYEEQHRREQQAAREREETRRREEKRKEQALATLDKDLDSVQQSITQENQQITLLQQRQPLLAAHIITAQQETERWQNGAEERAQTISTLNKKIAKSTEEYRQKELSLKPAHDERITQLLQETDATIDNLQQAHTKESQPWKNLLAQAIAEEQDLQNSREELESNKEELKSKIKKEKRKLTNLVIQAIEDKHKQVSTEHVLDAIESLGRSKEIFHATEHAQKVSLMVALILSGYFEADDLSSPESDYESIPKPFFKETRMKLLQTQHDSLKEDAFEKWNIKLRRLEQKRFLCCSC